MQQIHQGSPPSFPGQGSTPQSGWAGNGWNGQNQNSAMSSAYPHSQGYNGDYSTNSAVDDLVSGTSREAGGDDIDEIIRMAEKGIKPPKKVEAPQAPVKIEEPTPIAAPATDINTEPDVNAEVDVKPEADVKLEVEKKAKKDKPMKMIYSDNEVSPEEKMAKMPRYAFVPDGKTETSLVDAATVPGVAGTVAA
jgi:hypothetical protein